MLCCAVLSRTVVSNSLRPYGLKPARLLCPWGFSRREYWSGLPCLPPGIFPTQGSNPGLPHCRRILYCLSHQGSLRIMEWVASLFSRGYSWPRIQTRLSCIAGRFFTYTFYCFQREWESWGKGEELITFIYFQLFKFIYKKHVSLL